MSLYYVFLFSPIAASFLLAVLVWWFSFRQASAQAEIKVAADTLRLPANTTIVVVAFMLPAALAFTISPLFENFSEEGRALFSAFILILFILLACAVFQVFGLISLPHECNYVVLREPSHKHFIGFQAAYFLVFIIGLIVLAASSFFEVDKKTESLEDTAAAKGPHVHLKKPLIFPGMTEDMVRNAWGQPWSKIGSEWIYDTGTDRIVIFFDNKKLVTMSLVEK